MDLVDVFRVETQRAAVTRSGVRHQLNQHRADGRTHYELLKGGILRVCGGVNVCHPTWSFTMTHGGGCMSGSPPSSPLPPPTPSWSQTVPVVLCQLSLALGLISVNHSPALGSSFTP